MAKQKLGAAVSAAGSNVSKNEALKIAEATGKSVAQVMAKAVEKGATLGASLVNQFNAGNVGPNLSQTGIPQGLNPAVTDGTARALQTLQALEGLRMQPNTVYGGYSTTTSQSASGPGSTAYNPIVLPKSVITGVKPAAVTTAAPAAPAAPADAPPEKVDPNQKLIDSINAQIAANATQAELYMGQINDLMASMTTANKQQGLSSIAPYAVTSTTVDPASGAKTTSAVTPRKKPLVTDLSVDSLVSNGAGTGLNIAI